MLLGAFSLGTHIHITLVCLPFCHWIYKLWYHEAAEIKPSPLTEMRKVWSGPNYHPQLIVLTIIFRGIKIEVVYFGNLLFKFKSPCLHLKNIKVPSYICIHSIYVCTPLNMSMLWLCKSNIETENSSRKKKLRDIKYSIKLCSNVSFLIKNYRPKRHLVAWKFNESKLQNYYIKLALI